MRIYSLDLTHFGFLLQVKCVDFLQLALQPEEEGGLVRLQRGLRVLKSHSIGRRLLRGEDWGGAQFLDELFAGVSGNWFEVCVRVDLRTFLSAL